MKALIKISFAFLLSGWTSSLSYAQITHPGYHPNEHSSSLTVVLQNGATYRSRDGGISWRRTSSEMADPNSYYETHKAPIELHIVKQDNSHFVSYDGGISMWDDKLAEQGNKTSEPKFIPMQPVVKKHVPFDPVPTPPAGLEVERVVPDPARGKTTIVYTLNAPQRVYLTLQDGAGSDIMTLVDEQQTAGSHTKQFDVSRLPTGNYTYLLRGDRYQTSGRLVVIH